MGAFFNRTLFILRVLMARAEPGLTQAKLALDWFWALGFNTMIQSGFWAFNIWSKLG